MKENLVKRKILIVDDHSIVREGLKQIINLEDDLIVAGEASCSDEAIKKLCCEKYDLAIVDISLEDNSNGIDLVKAIKSRFPEVKTLVLSMHDESIYAERVIRAGARGYVMKKDAHSKIILAIYKIFSNELYLSNEISRKIIDKIMHGADNIDGDISSILSDRELEIFVLIGQGYGTSDLAKKLNITINTVQSHKRNLKEKLSCKDSTELVKNAFQWVQINKSS